MEKRYSMMDNAGINDRKEICMNRKNPFIVEEADLRASNLCIIERRIA